MISFIVIGRNEEKYISICIQSIYDAIGYCKLREFEIVYVDSNSTDKSIEKVLAFKGIKIIKLQNYWNAAIGRNVGALESKGEILFFIDGDMEITKDFLLFVLDGNQNIKYDFVSGIHIAVNYYSNKKVEEKKYGFGDINYDHYIEQTGGIFIIKRNTWNLAGGMRNEFKRSQDIDLALRLIKKNIFLLQKKEVINKHHTIPNIDSKRMWNILKNKLYLYSGLLIKKNFLNKYLWKRVLRYEYSFIFLLTSIIFVILFSKLYFLLIYLLIVIVRASFNKKEFISVTFYLIVRDITILFSILFFYPKSIPISQVKYNRIIN